MTLIKCNYVYVNNHDFSFSFIIDFINHVESVVDIFKHKNSIILSSFCSTLHSIRMYIKFCTTFLVYWKYEPSRGKTNNVVFEQARHKPACTVTEKS